MMRTPLMLGIVFWLIPLSLFGQACCSGGTPLAGNIGLRPLRMGNIFIDLTYDYNTQQSLLAGSEILNDDRRERNTHAVLFRGGYALTDHLALSGIISWINEKENVDLLSGGINRFSATGIGDAIALVQYEPVKWRNKNLVFGTGVKFPLGRTDIADEETGLLLNPDLQPGSGSWDWILGVHFQQQHIFKDNLTLISSITARFNSEADRFGGQQPYQFGRELRVNLGVRDRYLIGRVLLDPSIMLLYRRTEMDQVNDSPVPNTGGNWIHLLPSLNWQVSTSFSVGASVEIPLYRDLMGTQLTTTRRMTLTIAYQLGQKTGFIDEPGSTGEIRF